jgi:LPXTG-motif cell wall-anchored protein
MPNEQQRGLSLLALLLLLGGALWLWMKRKQPQTSVRTVVGGSALPPGGVIGNVKPVPIFRYTPVDAKYRAIGPAIVDGGGLLFGSNPTCPLGYHVEKSGEDGGYYCVPDAAFEQAKTWTGDLESGFPYKAGSCEDAADPNAACGYTLAPDAEPISLSSDPVFLY